MSNPESVYRGSGPAVTSWWAEFTEALEAHRLTLQAIEREFPDRKIYISRSGQRRSVVGVTVLDGEYRNPPEGWRYDRRLSCLVPKVSTKAGKEHARILATGAVNLPAAPGMPTDQFVGLHLLSPGYEEHDGIVYVTWGAPPEQIEQGGGRVGGPIDLDIWHRCPLSEYHAMREAAP